MSNYITVSPSRRNFNCFFKIEQQAGYTSRNAHNRAQNRTHDRVRYPDSSRRPRNRNRASRARFCLNKTVFRLQIKRTVLENQIILFGDLHQLQRSGHRVGAIARQTHTPAFRQRNAPDADTAARLVHERHLLLGFGASCRRSALTVSKSAPGMRDCFCIKSQ